VGSSVEGGVIACDDGAVLDSEAIGAVGVEAVGAGVAASESVVVLAAGSLVTLRSLREEAVTPLAERDA
jgi:hypothetical protein